MFVGQAGLFRIAHEATVTRDELHDVRRDDTRLIPWRRLLEDWFQGRVDECDLFQRTGFFDLSACTPFQKNVYAALCRIPRGEVTSYGELAAAIDKPRAARAVGRALAANPIPLLIPCHRVVPAGGGVGHYSGGATAAAGSVMKERLLQWEGALPGLMITPK